MIKAVFLDYTGTIIEEGGPDGMEMLKRCWKNSDIESMEAMLAYWWKLIKAYEAVSYKESYITEDSFERKFRGASQALSAFLDVCPSISRHKGIL